MADNDPHPDTLDMPAPSSPRETYLGDGLYASHDGYAITLRAPRAGGDHEVVLEPLVLDAFLTWVKSRGQLPG